MSYILDALKKSEGERRRKKVPDLLGGEQFIHEEKKKRPIWPYLVVAALLLNAGFFTLWLTPWQAKKTQIPAHTDMRRAADSRKESAAPLLLSESRSVDLTDKKELIIESKYKRNDAAKSTATNIRESRRPSSERLETKGRIENSRGAAGIPQETFSFAPQKRMPEEKVSNEEESLTSGAVPIKDKIYNLNDLPLSIRQKLPSFDISISLYSEDPSLRMARINDYLLREGQYLVAGLRLEEIRPDGIIFNYKDYRFRVNLK
ncbi:MAG: general secretion pathway protein GspB [Nitrospirota bacterium]